MIGGTAAIAPHESPIEEVLVKVEVYVLFDNSFSESEFCGVFATEELAKSAYLVRGAKWESPTEMWAPDTIAVGRKMGDFGREEVCRALALGECGSGGDFEREEIYFIERHTVVTAE